MVPVRPMEPVNVMMGLCSMPLPENASLHALEMPVQTVTGRICWAVLTDAFQVHARTAHANAGLVSQAQTAQPRSPSPTLTTISASTSEA